MKEAANPAFNPFLNQKSGGAYRVASHIAELEKNFPEFAAQLQKIMENEIPVNFISAFLKRKFPDDISCGKESIDMVQYVTVKLIHLI